MDKFFELLERIEKKRYLYIGDENLIALKQLMDGYAQCLIDYGIKSKESLNHDYIAFERFVYSALEAEKSGKSFWTIIIERSKSNNEAYSTFFRLLHAYMKKE